MGNGHPPVGNAPMAQGTRQASDIPPVQETPSTLHSPPTGQDISQRVVPSSSSRTGEAPPVQPFEAFGADTYAPQQTPPPGSQDSYTPPPTPFGQQNPFVAQRTGPQGPLPPRPIPAGQPGQQRRRFPTGTTVLLIVLAVLLIGGGSGLIYYTTVYQPNLKHAQATATAVAHITGTAHAEATSTAQAQTNATATSIAVQNPYGGTLSLDDPLHVSSDRWPDRGGCQFIGGAYHVSTSQPGNSLYCDSVDRNFSDFAYQVKLTIVSGGQGGISFRYNARQGTDYTFLISASQTYRFLSSSATPSIQDVLRSGASTAIHAGLNQSNLIAVVARGSNFKLYVNQQLIAAVNDDIYSYGGIGLVAAYFSGPTEVIFNDVKVWTL